MKRSSSDISYIQPTRGGANHWGQVYDVKGSPRYAIEMINIASDSLLPSQHDQFYEAFNSLESYIDRKPK